MSKKYRFRKMYFVCKDKKVIEPEIQAVNAYQNQENAAAIARQTDRTHYMWLAKDWTPPIVTVEGFYLVPEALFNAILKDHYKE